MLEVPFDDLTLEQKKFVDDLCRCFIFDVVRINEIDKLLDDGTFKNLDEYKDTMYDAAKFLGHICNSCCLVKTPTGEF